jgi:hypothetical protein
MLVSGARSRKSFVQDVSAANERAIIPMIFFNCIDFNFFA